MASAGAGTVARSRVLIVAATGGRSEGAMKRQKKSGSPAKRKKAPSPTRLACAKAVEFRPDGSRIVHLVPEQVEILEAQRVAFREKFGRDRGPNDPIFFDANADEPRELPPMDPMKIEAIALQAG